MEAIDVFVQDVNEFQREFNDVIHAGQRLCFITRGKELQIEALDTLASIKTKAEQLKERAIAHEYEDAANFLLSFEEMANALTHELNMWISVKEEKYAEAWDFLVNAQMAAIHAMRAHRVEPHYPVNGLKPACEDALVAAWTESDQATDAYEGDLAVV